MKNSWIFLLDQMFFFLFLQLVATLFISIILINLPKQLFVMQLGPILEFKRSVRSVQKGHPNMTTQAGMII